MKISPSAQNKQQQSILKSNQSSPLTSTHATPDNQLNKKKEPQEAIFLQKRITQPITTVQMQKLESHRERDISPHSTLSTASRITGVSATKQKRVKKHEAKMLAKETNQNKTLGQHSVRFKYDFTKDLLQVQCPLQSDQSHEGHLGVPQEHSMEHFSDIPLGFIQDVQIPHDDLKSPKETISERIFLKNQKNGRKVAFSLYDESKDMQLSLKNVLKRANVRKIMEEEDDNATDEEVVKYGKKKLLMYVFIILNKLKKSVEVAVKQGLVKYFKS